MGYNRYFDDFHTGGNNNASGFGVAGDADATDFWPGWTYTVGVNQFGVKSDAHDRNDGWDTRANKTTNPGLATSDAIEIDEHRIFQTYRSIDPSWSPGHWAAIPFAHPVQRYPHEKQESLQNVQEPSRHNQSSRGFFEIKYKGFQVAPAELEAVLLKHPQVADAAVIPIPDDDAGEVPKAFVVLKSPVPLEDLLAYVSEQVSPYKKIRIIEVLDQIPKSPSGKILRRLLIEKERSRS